MKEAIRDYLPWLLSVITIWMTLLAGNKHRSAWQVGLGNQVLWSIWIVVTETWGLIPLNVVLWGVYYRNHILWKAHEPQREVTVQTSRDRSLGLDSKSAEPYQ